MAPLQGGADSSLLFSRITPDLVVLLAFVGGVGEEFLFRSLLQTYLHRRTAALLPSPALALYAAILLQTALFGLAHATYANPQQVLVPFALGLLWGIAFHAWGFAAVAYGHAAFDFIGFAQTAARHGYPSMGVAAYAFTFLNLMVGLMYGFVLLRNHVRRSPR